MYPCLANPGEPIEQHCSDWRRDRSSVCIKIVKQVIRVKRKASVLVQLDANDVGEVEDFLVILTVKYELKFPIRHLYICKEIPIIVVEWGL